MLQEVVPHRPGGDSKQAAGQQEMDTQSASLPAARGDAGQARAADSSGKKAEKNAKKRARRTAKRQQGQELKEQEVRDAPAPAHAGCQQTCRFCFLLSRTWQL